MPPLASSNRPLRSSTAPVKAPRSWPNSSDSSSVSGSAAQLTATNGRSARGPALVDRAGDHLLPRPALPAQQHGGARRGDAGHRGEDLLHPLALADDALDPVRLPDRLFEFLALASELVLEPVDRLVELQGLPDEAADHGQRARVAFQRPGARGAGPLGGDHAERLGADADGDGDVGKGGALRFPVGPGLVEERGLLPDVGEGDRAARLHRLPDDPLAPDVPRAVALLRGIPGRHRHADLAGGLVGAEDGGAVETQEALERAQGDAERTLQVLRGSEDLGHLVDGRDLGFLGRAGVGHPGIIA